MKVAASEDTGPARTADGAGGEGVHELHPGLGDDLPGGHHGVRAAHGDVLVVSEDEDDVRSGDGGDPDGEAETEAQQEPLHSQHLALCHTRTCEAAADTRLDWSHLRLTVFIDYYAPVTSTYHCFYCASILRDESQNILNPCSSCVGLILCLQLITNEHNDC